MRPRCSRCFGPAVLSAGLWTVSSGGRLRDRCEPGRAVQKASNGRPKTARPHKHVRLQVRAEFTNSRPNLYRRTGLLEGMQPLQEAAGPLPAALAAPALSAPGRLAFAKARVNVPATADWMRVFPASQSVLCTALVSSWAAKGIRALLNKSVSLPPRL